MYHHEYIQQLLPEIFDFIKTTFEGKEELLFVSLKGSQNYDLDTDTSDYDFIGILLPDIHQSIFPKYHTTKRHLETPLGQITLFTYTEFCQMLYKQNPTFLEILFSKYKHVNPEYQTMLQPLFDNAETLSSWNFYKQRASLLGQIDRHTQDFYAECKKGRFERAAKHLAMGYYFFYFLLKRAKNTPMADCYSISSYMQEIQNLCKNLKNNQIPTTEQAKLAVKLNRKAKGYHDKTKDFYTNNDCPQEVQTILVDVYRECGLYYMQKGDAACN